MTKKIAIIGAGTAVFSLNMIRDICLTPNLEGCTVQFMDINEERLVNAYNLCVRLAEEANIKLTLLKTMDRKEALQGADFVINCALVGGHQRLKDGWDLAKKHGYKFGGSLHIVHDEGFWINYGQLDLMEAVLLDMLEICPQAWYMLVANPVMAGVTYLSRKYPQVKLAGFCHGSNGVNQVAKVLGLDPDEITFEVPGVNHFIWLTEFRHKGENAFPILDKWIETQSQEYFKTCAFCDSMGPKAIDLYQRFGAFPIGDTGNPGGGSWGYWYHSDEQTQQRWKEDPDEWYQGYFRHCADGIQKIKEVGEDKTRKVFDVLSKNHSTEPMIPFIESIAFDVPRVIILNVPNDRNYVEGIPLDFQVEIPCMVSANGVKGIRTNGLPKPLIEYALRDRVASVEMEISAYENKSYEQLLQMIMMDPWTQSEKQAKALLDDILNIPYMSEMKNHYI